MINRTQQADGQGRNMTLNQSTECEGQLTTILQKSPPNQP